MRNTNRQTEFEELRRQLDESRETLRAIRTGEVDALVVSGPQGDQVYVLKGAEQPYRDFVETMNEGAVTLTRDGTITYSNGRFARMLEAPLEQVIGASLASFVPSGQRSRLQHVLDQAAARRCSAVLPFLTGSGTTVWAELSMGPVALGDSIGVCLVVNDITERRKAEELRAYLASIVDSTDDAIIGTDLDGTIVSWNPGARKLFGYGAREALGRPLTGLAPPERAGEILGYLAKAARGEAVERFETERIRKGGERVYVSVTVSPVRDQDGCINGVSAINHDITARKRAEDELRKSQSMLEHVLQSIPQAVFWKDREGVFRGGNQALAQTSGLQRLDEILGKTVFDVPTFRANAEAYTADDREVMENNQAKWHINEPLQQPEGSTRWVDTTKVPLSDASGKVYGVLGVCEDITERRQAAELIRRQAEAERRRGFYHRSLIEASLDPLVTIGSDGRITDVNRATELATGCSREELIGTDFCDYFTDPQRARDGYRQVFSEGVVHDYELEIRHREGRTTPVVYNASVYRDETGTVTGVFAAARNITKRKEAEQALKAERQRLYAVLETLPAMICLLTPDYHVAFANRSFRAKFGESGGRHCYEYCFGRGQPCEFCESFTVLKTGQPHHWEVAAADGSVIDVHDFPFTDADGAPLILEMDLDITERRRAEEALARQKTELERSNAELQQFAYVASHDLQEPLRAVASFTKLLAERYQGRLDRDADEFIEFAVDGAKRAQRLINDLLAYSRVGTRGTAFSPTDCEAVLENALSDLAATLEETAGQVTHEPLPVIDADETQIGQLFRNLIGNALKFHGPEPPRVHVSARQITGAWQFSVRDNGIGIAPEYSETIFEVFQRLHTSQEYPGTGIGLAIAKKIAGRHGGRIWMESRPGKGTTFFFTIPVRKGGDHAG